MVDGDAGCYEYAYMEHESWKAALAEAKQIGEDDRDSTTLKAEIQAAQESKVK
jgi:hypothetical protein